MPVVQKYRLSAPRPPPPKQGSAVRGALDVGLGSVVMESLFLPPRPRLVFLQGSWCLGLCGEHEGAAWVGNWLVAAHFHGSGVRGEVSTWWLCRGEAVFLPLRGAWHPFSSLERATSQLFFPPCEEKEAR